MIVVEAVVWYGMTSSSVLIVYVRKKWAGCEGRGRI